MKDFGFFEIPADNMERAINFYKDMFDWKFEETAIGNSPYYAITTPGGGVPGGLISRQHENHSWTNYITVDDCEAYLEQAKELGAKVVLDLSTLPGQGYYALLADPDGNVFGLWEENSSAR